MREITFYPLHPKAEKSLIYYSIYCDDGRLRRSTDVKILTSTWLKGKRKGSCGWFDPGAKNNLVAGPKSQLNHVKSKVDKHLLYCSVNNLPVLQQDIEAIVRTKVQVGQLSFFEIYEQLIKDALSGELLTRKNKRYSPGAMKYWRLNMNLLKKYAFEKRKNLEPTALNEATVRGFITWMNKQEHGQKNGEKVQNSFNYVNLHFRQWRNIVDIMKSKGYHKSLVAKEDYFKPMSEEIIDKVTMKEDDVLKLYNFDLSNTPYYDAVRDRWIIMYCTGLRVSDSRRLQLNHLGKEFITMVNKKTGKKVVIPYHWMVEEILQKYNGGLPPNYSEVVLNREIKKIGKWAGFTDLFTYKITRGGKQVVETLPRYELFANHMARRSLVTNMIRQGVTHDVGGDIVGMSPQTWARYNKLTAEDKAEVVKDMGVFRKK